MIQNAKRIERPNQLLLNQREIIPHKEKKGILVETCFGEFYLTATSRGLLSLDFPSKFNPPQTSRESSLLQKAAKSLREYLKGEPVSLSHFQFDLDHTTHFERKVLEALSTLGRGEVITYGSLAERSGFKGAARAVGMVMSKNRLPIFLPCHRVLGSQGGLGGYSLGLDWKRRLLKLEGYFLS